MVTNMIDASMLTKMFLAGAKNLEVKKEWINELNVFPVPDGDTGTNMTLTIMSAANEVRGLDNPSMEALAKAISSGSLRGARGNSGVILSQLLRGFTKGIRDYDKLDTVIVAAAMQKAVETAYKAVMKPKEGTILTVAKGMSEKAAEIAEETDDFTAFFDAVTSYGDEVLSQTPEMLPVLKEAGVVDAGGKGLLFIYHGMLEALKRDTDEVDLLAALNASAASSAEQHNNSAQAVFSTESIEFGYCTEFIVDGVENAEEKEAEVREYLSTIGDSLVVVADGDLIKIHVHTNDPGLAIQKGISLGSLSSIKIDNMRLQHQNTLNMTPTAVRKEEPRKDIGFITISVGEGLKNIFKELGVDYVISGGQTMNPSTEDILKAAQQINADHIFVLPNNKNIILAAQQAAGLLEDKTLHVIPTRSVPQGITAMISYMPGESAEINEAQMTESLGSVESGAVTYAVRDTHMGEFQIRQGDILALKNDEICQVGTDLMETTKELMDAMISEESSIITVYYGTDADPAQAEELRQYVEELHPDLEVEIQKGGQPLYYFLLSAE